MGANGVASFAHDLPSYGIPAFLGYFAAYGELFGGVLLIPGLLTRIDAFLLACTMFVATFVVQLPDALHDPDAGNKFFASMHAVELPLSLFAASVALVLLGGGSWSVDAVIARARAKTKASGERRAGDG
jgi:putative oxidoreductase